MWVVLIVVAVLAAGGVRATAQIPHVPTPVAKEVGNKPAGKITVLDMGGEAEVRALAKDVGIADRLEDLLPRE